MGDLPLPIIVSEGAGIKIWEFSDALIQTAGAVMTSLKPG
jgi:hypothetical protein